MTIPDQIAEHVVSTVVVGALGFVSWLVKSHFAKINESNADIKTAIAGLSGQIDALQKSLHMNTTETAVVRADVKALWRFHDRAFQRASDAANGGDD